MSKTVDAQYAFLVDVTSLIAYAHDELLDVMLTGGDLYQDNDWHREYSSNQPGKMYKPYDTPHLKSGQHPKRLAIDLNMFVDGVYITGHHARWDDLGMYWLGLSLKNKWGGNFKINDFNHFERQS